MNTRAGGGEERKSGWDTVESGLNAGESEKKADP